MRRLAEVHFGRFHERFGERRMGVNRFGDVAGDAGGFDGQHAFRDQFAGPRTHDAHAQQAFGLGIEQELGQPFGP